MAKNHVGRPSNEELAARKRKQLLKVLLPTGIIAIVVIMVIGNTGLKNLMGASVGNCTCDDGYDYDEYSKVCYQEDSDESQEIQAYILGDANNNRIIDYEDYTIMKDNISSNVNLDNIQQAVYNVNQNTNADKNNINMSDATELLNYFGITQTNGYKVNENDSKITYVCPNPTEIVTTDENNVKTITKTIYTPAGDNNEKCKITTTVRREKAPIMCTDGSSGLSNPSDDSDDLDDVEKLDVPADDDEYIYEEKYDDEIEEINGNYNVSDDDDSEISINDTDVVELNEIVTNSYNYKVNTDINETGINLEYYEEPYFYLENRDYVKNEDYKINDSILNESYYSIYSNDKCEGSVLHSFKTKNNSGTKLHWITQENSKKTNKLVDIKHTKIIVTEIKLPKKFENGNMVSQSSLYIKQTKSPSGYKQKTTKICKKIKIFYKSKTRNKKTTRVKFSNSPIDYTIKADNNVIYNSSTKKYVNQLSNAKYNHEVKIKAIDKTEGKTFKGYSVTRQYKNNSNQTVTQYRCYTDKNKTAKQWQTTPCDNNTMYYLGKNGANITRINAKANAIVNLKAEYSLTNYKITYKLNGGTNNAKNPTKYNIKTSTITFANPTKKGYTFGGWYSDAKLTKNVTKIAKGSTGAKTLYAKWTIKNYKITYNLNGGTNNTKNPTKYNVNTSTITLASPTKKGYKFKGWYSDAKFTKKVTRIIKGSTGSKTLYAKWEK